MEVRYPVIPQTWALSYHHTLCLKTEIFNGMSTGLWSEEPMFARVFVVAGVSGRTRSKMLSPLVGSLMIWSRPMQLASCRAHRLAASVTLLPSHS